MRTAKKTACLAFVAMAAATPVLAAPPPKPICIDPHYAYQARYLDGHDIVAKAMLGHDHRELKLSTTCIFLRSADHIALSADFNCVGRGDTVVTSTVDGHQQACRITHVEPYVAAPAEQHG